MGNAAITREQKLAGRTQHLLIDTAGTLRTVVVQRATIADWEGAYVVLNDVTQHDPAL